MRARRRSVSPRRSPPATRGFWSEALAIVVMAFAVLLVLSLASYRADDPVPWPLGRWSGEPVRNVAGIVGAFLAELLHQLLGHAAWTAPILLLLAGWRSFWGRRERTLAHVAGYALMLGSAAACLHLLMDAGTPGTPAV
ncbi:MAG TPA: DNA translocase FtsK 4TM domain-containing protein, partial [Candidatus Polarisedimenticolia bacterium]|nr:DNA translocase FtsK 4TM domain-containing protein [Candidatus Polarisedimenticolia bacterium]